MVSQPVPFFAHPPNDPALVQNPYAIYDRMRAAGRAVWWADYDLLCFHRFDDVNALLRDRRLGREILHTATREELGWPEIPSRLSGFYAFESHSILEREPPVHTRLRRLINRAFVSRAVDTLRPRVRELTNEILDNLDWTQPVDLMGPLCERVPLTVICELLGTPVDAGPQMLRWSHDMVAMYEFNRDRTTEDRAEAATKAFGAFMSDFIEAKRRNPADDLLSSLIAAEEAGDHLSSEELLTTAILLMNAGHEATVHALANSIKALIEQPVDTAEAFATPARATATVEELLRFDAPLHMFTRYVLEDMTHGGIDLHRGQSVGLLLGAANHDPDRFADPGRFDPDRGENGQVTFGAGIHFCVGAPLARVEMEETLSVLFGRYPNLTLAEPPTYADRYHFHGLSALNVVAGQS